MVQHAKVIVVDEVDACIKEDTPAMETLMTAACTRALNFTPTT